MGFRRPNTLRVHRATTFHVDQIWSTRQGQAWAMDVYFILHSHHCLLHSFNSVRWSMVSEPRCKHAAMDCDIKCRFVRIQHRLDVVGIPESKIDTPQSLPLRIPSSMTTLPEGPPLKQVRHGNANLGETILIYDL